MKTIIFTGLTLIALCSCTSKSQKAKVFAARLDTVQRLTSPPPISDEEKARYHNAVQNVLEHSLLRTRFNGGILIAKDGNIVYEKYIGFADLKPRHQDSVTANTPFQIASTSKTLTAGAILKLIQEGKISLEDSISKFFPGFPYPGITVKSLLSHRSGLPNYLYYMEKSPWDRKKLASNADVLKTLYDWHPAPAYRPNARFHYCNTNYVLLALIIEKVSGLPYPVYMKKNIFDPLGMTHTFVHTMNDSLSVTQSYKPNGGLWTLDYSDGPYGDKNIYSTPEDLLKWDQSLYQHIILNQPILDSAFTPYSNERPGIKNYGLGWRMLDFPNGKKVIYHNGHWHGFNSAFARLTDEHATIIILSNRFNPAVYTTAKRLYNLFGNYDGRNDEGEE